MCINTNQETTDTRFSKHKEKICSGNNEAKVLMRRMQKRER